MNFRTVLWKKYMKKDGTCDIKIYLNHQNKRKYISTRLNVAPKDWDEQKEIVRSTNPLASRYNAILAKMRFDIQAHFLEGGTWDNLFGGNKDGGLVDLLESIVEEGRGGILSIKKNTIGNYNSLLTRLKQYEKKTGERITMQEVDMNFYQKFTSFLVSDGNCRPPGVDSHIKVFKRVMNIGLERKLHTNTIHQESGFRRKRNKSDKIFLNEEEVAILEKIDLSNQPHLKKELDRWLIAYYFLLRFSDLQKLSRKNLTTIDGRFFLKYRSQKTQKEATIPVRERALELMKEYDFDFSWGTNQQANRQLKMAIVIAGLNEPVEQGGITAPKSSFVTMHTARRSAATNLYLSGEFSIKTIADLGGWENIRTLQIYLRCSNTDSAKLAAKSDYFL